MSIAELIEQVNRKRQELEESRGIISDSLLKVMEAEIEEMETALASGDEQLVAKLVFIDECGG